MFRKIFSKSQASWAFVDQALVSGVNFVVALLLLRLLGVVDYGVYVLLWAAFYFCLTIQNSLVTGPMQSLAPNVDISIRNSYYTSVLVWMVVLISAAVIIFLVTVELFRFYLPVWIVESMYVIPPLVALFVIHDFFRKYFFLVSSPAKAFLIDCLAYGGQLALVAFTLPDNGGYLDALSRVMIAFGCSVTVALFFFKLEKVKFVHVVDSLTRHWLSGRWLLGSGVMHWLAGNYYLVTAGVVMGPAIVGAIRAAQNFAGITHIVLQGMENFAPKSASICLGRDGVAGLRSYVGKIAFILFVATGLGVMLMALFSSKLFLIAYGKADDVAITAAYWFVPIYIVLSLHYPYYVGLRSLEKTKPVFIAYCVSSLFSLLTAQLVISEFGLVGVMAGMLCCQIILLLLMYCGFRLNIR